MPKRTDIKSVLIIGAGPIVIGQACEFDYSGAQACKALREEGYRVILVNSNPATIMTDPAMADAIYIEPVDWRVVRNIIAREKPDAVLPTMGGQTALNCALDLAREGVLEEFGVEMIGARPEAIDMAEDRDKFRMAMTEIGLATPRAAIAHSMQEAWEGQTDIGFPCIIRPSFTMGGSGGGLHTTGKSSKPLSHADWIFRAPAKCCSRSLCWVGKNMKWKWCVTMLTTSLLSVPSKTSTRWESILVTRLQ